MTNKIKF